MLLSSPNSLALMENVSVDVRKNIISWINPSNFLSFFPSFCPYFFAEIGFKARELIPYTIRGLRRMYGE